MIAYIKRHHGIATQVSVIKVNVTVIKNRNSKSKYISMSLRQDHLIGLHVHARLLKLISETYKYSDTNVRQIA